ncbi:MAG: adenylate/guanylate cyclase domain-containing protein [Alphaproteobacteria bacterium]|nr:adenylate/guanylate cyclase domain-containing protein [Alphaproteobacteria bacterium]
MTYIVQTLHPLDRVAIMTWREDRERTEERRASHGTERAAIFLDSPIRRVFEGAGEIRRRLEGPDAVLDFPILKDLAEEGTTDYMVMPVPFSDRKINAVTFASRRPGGFSDVCRFELRTAVRVLAPLLELRWTQGLALILADTYLGPRSGRRVLDGAIVRGMSETLEAVVWMCDLRGFTTLAETMPRDRVLAALNEFFETMAKPVGRHGGEILKFIGDAMLAIFPVEPGVEVAGVAGRALAAASEAESEMDRLNRKREGEGDFALDFGLALHVGELAYGNIGAPDRLDFTVIGPAVNLASRLQGLSPELGRRVVLSADFTRAAGGGFPSLGAHRLKGLETPQEVFAPA